MGIIFIVSSFFFFFFGLIKLIVEKENVCEYLTEYFVIIILARQ
jgi:hypothetical protein